jgi:hypothetical protein
MGDFRFSFVSFFTSRLLAPSEVEQAKTKTRVQPAKKRNNTGEFIHLCLQFPSHYKSSLLWIILGKIQNLWGRKKSFPQK